MDLTTLQNRNSILEQIVKTKMNRPYLNMNHIASHINNITQHYHLQDMETQLYIIHFRNSKHSKIQKVKNIDKNVSGAFVCLLITRASAAS